MDGVHYGSFHWAVHIVGRSGVNLQNPDGVRGRDYGSATTLEEAQAACERRLRDLVEIAEH